MTGREELKHLVTTSMIEEESSREKNSVKRYWMDKKSGVKVRRKTEALKATRGKGGWKVMIAYVNEHGT